MKKRAEEEGRTPKQASVPSTLGLMVNRSNNAALSDPGREVFEGVDALISEAKKF